MKTTKIVQSKFIQGADGFDSSAEFNQAMLDLAEMNPTFERDGNSFWIFYYVVKTEPENIVEEHELKGEHINCIACPHIIRDLNRFGNPDGVKKHATCGLTGERVRIDSRVCESYYTERG